MSSSISLTAEGLQEAQKGRRVQREGARPYLTAWLCRDSPFVAVWATLKDGRQFDSLAEPTLKVMRVELFQTITSLSLQDEAKVSCRLLAWNQDGKIS